MTKETNVYEALSEERKALQEKGDIPPWATTAGWQFFKNKYLYECGSWREQYQRIARTAAKHTDDPAKWEEKFFDLMWKGWLSLSTPVLANMGTNRGLPVSCSAIYVDDSVQGFYEAATELAILSKWGFGTAAYLSDIRPRGSKISVGGKADGKLPVVKLLTSVCRDISQGSARRGAGAWYIDIEDGDFWEVLGHLEAHPDDLNIGWNVKNSFIDKLNSGDEDAINRYQSALRVKMTLGKGYFFFVDKANDKRPESYKNQDLYIKSSNLCSEIALFSDKNHTFTCVLSSMNVYLWDEWKDTDAVFTATVFLDCVCSEFIQMAKDIPWLEKAVRFTTKGRALGLGQMGLMSLLQKKSIPVESFEANSINNLVAKHIHDESLKASQWMAKTFGEPEWCKGLGIRNTHRIAVAPTKSCITAESKVVLADGGTISYKEILAMNGLKESDFSKKSGSWFDIEPLTLKTPEGEQVVSRMFYNGVQECFELTFSRGDERYTLTCTDNHSLRTVDGIWLTALEMESGLEFDGGWTLISIIYVGEKPTYDVEVPNEHCYFLESGIVSHNTASIMGGVSEGINPDPGMTFSSSGAVGDIERVNPVLLGIMKEKGLNVAKCVREINKADGSVKDVAWLTDHEKSVFKTAFEIDQHVLIRLASNRQRWIDQGQSLNLFFAHNDSETYISEVHQAAFTDPNILGLYYVYSSSSIKADRTGECEACQ